MQPPTSTELLFVYGTLLSGDTGPTGRAQRARLAREARVVAAATVGGLLYNLGRYPGLVPGGTNPVGGVVGEVLALAAPTRTLAWLDDYEGIVPGNHAHNEYERRRLQATLADGGIVEAWTYVYRRPVARARVIPGGSWLAR